MVMKTIIYLVGNPLVEEDAMPLKLGPQLSEAFPDIEFREFDPTENLPEDSEELLIIDTILGIKEPMIFNDIDDFSSQKTYSMHDFDLGWVLKLYKKLNMIKKIKIIGVPPEGDMEAVFESVKDLINTLSQPGL